MAGAPKERRGELKRPLEELALGKGGLLQGQRRPDGTEWVGAALEGEGGRLAADAWLARVGLTPAQFARALMPDFVEVVTDVAAWERLAAQATEQRVPRLLMFSGRAADAEARAEDEAGAARPSCEAAPAAAAFAAAASSCVACMAAVRPTAMRSASVRPSSSALDTPTMSSISKSALATLNLRSTGSTC